MRKSRFSALVAVLAACLGQPAQAQVGAVKRGADIFATECSECHSARAGKNKKGPSLHAVIAGRGHIRPARRPLLAHKAQCRPEPHDPRKHFRRQAHVLAKEIQQAP